MLGLKKKEKKRKTKKQKTSLFWDVPLLFSKSASLRQVWVASRADPQVQALSRGTQQSQPTAGAPPCPLVSPAPTFNEDGRDPSVAGCLLQSMPATVRGYHKSPAGHSQACLLGVGGGGWLRCLSSCLSCLHQYSLY